jgi:hypothetical protein
VASRIGRAEQGGRDQHASGTYASKEDLAMTAELELWDAFVAQVAAREIHGPVLTVLRDSLVDAITGLGPDWDERFLATRGLLARTPALWDRSIVLSMRAQERIVEQLEAKLGIDGRADVCIRLLGEFALAAWRCAAKNWIRAGRRAGPHRTENTSPSGPPGSPVVPGRGPHDSRPATPARRLRGAVAARRGGLRGDPEGDRSDSAVTRHGGQRAPSRPAHRHRRRRPGCEWRP